MYIRNVELTRDSNHTENENKIRKQIQHTEWLRKGNVININSLVAKFISFYEMRPLQLRYPLMTSCCVEWEGGGKQCAFDSWHRGSVTRWLSYVFNIRYCLDRKLFRLQKYVLKVNANPICF